MPFGFSQASASQKAVLNALFGWGPAGKAFSTEVFRKRRQLSSIREIGNNPALSGRITLRVAVRHKRIVYNILSSGRGSGLLPDGAGNRKSSIKRGKPRVQKDNKSFDFFFLFTRERERVSHEYTHCYFKTSYFISITFINTSLAVIYFSCTVQGFISLLGRDLESAHVWRTIVLSFSLALELLILRNFKKENEKRSRK